MAAANKPSSKPNGLNPPKPILNPLDNSSNAPAGNDSKAKVQKDSKVSKSAIVQLKPKNDAPNTKSDQGLAKKAAAAKWADQTDDAPSKSDDSPPPPSDTKHDDNDDDSPGSGDSEGDDGKKGALHQESDVEGEDMEPVEKVGEGKTGGGKVHDSMFLLFSRETLEDVAAFLKKLSPISTFVRPHFDRDEGRLVCDQYVAAMFPRVAVQIQHLIDGKQKKKTAAKLVVHKIKPFVLHPDDMADDEVQSTNRFFVRLPQRMHWKPLKKHLERFFDQIRGLGLVEAKQFEIEIPLTNNRAHHRRQCVIWFNTREQAERRKERGGGDPMGKIKLTGRALEENLPFVRYLLHNYTWPLNMMLLDNDPKPKPNTHNKTEDDDEPTEQIEPSYFISCEWDLLQQKQQPKPKNNAAAPGATIAKTSATSK